MKKTIKLAVVAALALGATSAFATNGSDMIATGAKATGMGGVGIGVRYCLFCHERLRSGLGKNKCTSFRGLAPSINRL